MTHDADIDTLLAEPEVKANTKRPPMFKVVMMNDDYTPMDFVIAILQTVFRLQSEDATQIMLQIHHKGKGVCGIFTRDVAETKIDIVQQMARDAEFPLQCLLERE